MQLENYLNLQGKLSQNYKIFDKTGLYGFGDPSDVIKMGTIADNSPGHLNIIELSKSDISLSIRKYSEFINDFGNITQIIKKHFK